MYPKNLHKTQYPLMLQEDRGLLLRLYKLPVLYNWQLVPDFLKYHWYFQPIPCLLADCKTPPSPCMETVGFFSIFSCYQCILYSYILRSGPARCLALLLEFLICTIADNKRNKETILEITHLKYSKLLHVTVLPSCKILGVVVQKSKFSKH